MSATIGQPLDRLDGHLKITGAARYSADYPIEDLVYAAPIQSTIARGRVVRIDSSAAEKAPGVLSVITHVNAPRLHKPKNDFGSSTKLGESRPLFADDRIYYFGQYLGMIVADTLERVISAAGLVRVEYEEQEPILDPARGEQYNPPDDFAKTSYSRGNVSVAMEKALHKVRHTYTTPVEHHNPMEPSASTAVWHGNKLTLYDSTQWVAGARNVVADALGIDRDDVRIVSRFVGGGFGCKGFVWPHPICAAIAARHVGRPVKLALTRQQMFTSTGHRGATRQTLALGADASGKLVAVQHENLTDASMVDDFIERCGVVTSFLYDCPDLWLRNTGVRLNIATPTPMRAPGESTGLFALECAMDELAWQLKMCPVELRLKNYSQMDQEAGLPYSSKHLRECYEVAMEKFGWKKRHGEPRAHRQGHDLFGWGMATATYPGYRSPGAAKVRIFSDGAVLVSSATQDIGTGTYTTLAMVASEVLDVPLKLVRVELGDSSLPPAPVSGGSMTTASVTPAVKAAAEKALLNLRKRAGKSRESVDGLSVRELFRLVDVDMIEGEANVKPAKEAEKYAIHSFGAQFCEVRVDADTGEIRLTRHVAVFDIGRVMNVKTARSQAMGGITMGIGMALLEHTVYDHEHGRVVTNNLADYSLPVNADVPDIDVSFVEHPDFILSPIGARGLGEIGITGVAPAIANAVYHATGIRVRDLPITGDKLLAHRLSMPSTA